MPLRRSWSMPHGNRLAHGLSAAHTHTRNTCAHTTRPTPPPSPPPCLQADPTLTSYSRDLVTNAAKQLHAARMAVFDERSGNLFVTELGRVASHFYIRCGRVCVCVPLHWVRTMSLIPHSYPTCRHTCHHTSRSRVTCHASHAHQLSVRSGLQRAPVRASCHTPHSSIIHTSLLAQPLTRSSHQ
jgi:hypothetical protein